MPRRMWRRVLSILVVSAATAASALVWWRYDFEKVNWTWGVVAGVVGTFVVVRQILGDRDAVRGAPAVRRRAVAEQLAEHVRRSPVDEALLKTLEEPYPLPVSWSNAVADYQPSWRTICRSSEGEPLDLSGRDGAIYDSYLRVPSGRMLVLGSAGSGKSIMVMRLARRLIAERTSDGPIPLLLYVASWDAANLRFDHWIVSQIANRYPQLSMLHPRWAEAVRDLLNANLILPVLDGLDEMTEERAALCLRRLNELPAQRLVLTCRSGFYNRYLQQGEKLRGAAVILIEPLDPTKVANYLQDAAPLSQVARWRPVVEEMTRDGRSDLAEALSTPLMVAMARIAFDERETPAQVDPTQVDPSQVDPDDDDPGILVTLARDGGRQAVEEALLNDAVEIAIQPYRESWLSKRWPPAATREYLSFLAGHLEAQNQREFVWWRLPSEVPRLLWMLFDGVRVAVVTWITLALADDALRAMAAASDDSRLREALGALSDGSTSIVVMAGVMGATLSLLEELTGHQGVPPARIAFRGGFRTLGGGLLDGSFAGALVAGTLWAALQLYERARGIVSLLEPYALPVGSWSSDSRVVVTVGLFVCGYVVVRNALRVDFAAPADSFTVTEPIRVLRADRSAALLAVLPEVVRAVVLVVILFTVLSRSELLPAVPLETQAVAGLGVGIGWWVLTLSGSAWIRFVVTRLVLAATGRLPYRLLEFLAAVESVGLVREFGGTYRFRHDRLQNLLAVLGGRPRAARYREEFATNLAMVGYWEEALAEFGSLLAERAGRAGSDELLAEALRKSVFVGCAAGRWWRTEQRLLAVQALYPAPEVPNAPAVTAKRRKISELVRQGAAPDRLLAACDELIEAEDAAGRPELASREFRATLHYVLGDLAGARAQLDEMPAREYGEDLPHAIPVAAALLTRIALDDGAVDVAVATGQNELLLAEISPRPVDIARLAESWWWSVQVLAGTGDELAEQYRRLGEAARQAGRGTRWRKVRLTSREWVEIGLLVCRSRIRDPMLGGLAAAVARELVGIVNTPDRFLLAVDRSAAMWSDGALPPPRRDEDEPREGWQGPLLSPPSAVPAIE
ncbi:NACHT domain-containing protein [Plantactinospora solaniradicis]|uniref:NACHT domain-containing protein n=1 Tax=Plantactinospora solaniradicis TaxID=1723736 RepID=A0ABW1KLB1_9ACTN